MAEKLFKVPINIDVGTGTAPLVVSSSTEVSNLNAALLNGKASSAFMSAPVTYTTTTAAAENYYRIATIPMTSSFKDCIFKIKGYTATGTTSESTVLINLAYYSGNYTSQTSTITASTSHSYNAQTNAENGYVYLYIRVSFDATSGYIDVYKYKTTAVTFEVQPLTNNDWVWATGALTAGPAAGAYRAVSLVTYQGLQGNNIAASSASYASYVSYGIHCANTVSNSTNKTGQWSFFGYWTISYNSSYLKGHSGHNRIRLMELSYDGSKDPSTLDDFTVIMSTNVATHTDGTTFNSTVPTINIDIEGKTSLTSADICAITTATSTSTKTIKLYVKLKDTNTFYVILPESRYGRSWTTGYGQTNSYCYFTAAGDQATVASLPTPAQGSVTYSNMRSITAPAFISTIVTGTAPLTVASTTLVDNLNASYVQGLQPASTNTASSIVSRDSSGNFAAGTITAALTGNASTATKLATARTISLTGDVTGSASFDGSGDASITTTIVDDSHNHTIDNIDGLQTALDAKAPVASPTFTGTVTSSSGNFAVAANSAYGLGFWGLGPTSYGIRMSYADDSSAGRISTETLSDYNIYSTIVGPNRGFVFKGDSGINAQIDGSGYVHARTGFRAGKYSIEYNSTDDSLDFIYN